MDGDQLALGLEDLDADIARLQARYPAVLADDSSPQPTPSQNGLPDHLPREDVALDIEERVCPCCGGALHLIGESVSEMLDFVPAQLRVLRIRRPKYRCRACGTIHQAAAPERPIAKGMASPGLLAHVLVSKYCDHLPLYRQSQIFARQGVEIERSTLANWVGGACWWLEPLQARLAAHVFGAAKIFADDTPIPVLDPGRGRTKIGRLWVYTRDDRPWGGPDPPAAVYFYSSDRKAERPASHLEGFKGVLQVDGYAGFERLTAGGGIVLAACWAHTWRKLFDMHQATGSPIAAETLRRIAELYAIEKSIRGRGAEERRSVRNTYSRPLVEAMKPWLETQLRRIPGRGGLADAIRYALSRWPALCRFLDRDVRLAVIDASGTVHSLVFPCRRVGDRPSPVVALNRAIAIAQRDGPERGLEAIDAIEDRDRLAGYPFYPAALGELELRRGRHKIARKHFRAALALARNPMERRYLHQRVGACQRDDPR
jgi:transposase